METSFEDQLKEIESIIANIEKGDMKLEDSIKVYEKGMKLIHSCQKKLERAEKSLKIIEVSVDGEIKEKDFEEHEKEDGSEKVKDFQEKHQPKKRKKVKEEADSEPEKSGLEFDLF